jgi:hypothetical protein
MQLLEDIPINNIALPGIISTKAKTIAIFKSFQTQDIFDCSER